MRHRTRPLPLHATPPRTLVPSPSAQHVDTTTPRAPAHETPPGCQIWDPTQQNLEREAECRGSLSFPPLLPSHKAVALRRAEQSAAAASPASPIPRAEPRRTGRRGTPPSRPRFPWLLLLFPDSRLLVRGGLLCGQLRCWSGPLFGPRIGLLPCGLLGILCCLLVGDLFVVPGFLGLSSGRNGGAMSLISAFQVFPPEATGLF